MTRVRIACSDSKKTGRLDMRHKEGEITLRTPGGSVANLEPSIREVIRERDVDTIVHTIHSNCAWVKTAVTGNPIDAAMERVGTLIRGEIVRNFRTDPIEMNGRFQLQELARLLAEENRGHVRLLSEFIDTPVDNRRGVNRLIATFNGPSSIVYGEKLGTFGIDGSKAFVLHALDPRETLSGTHLAIRELKSDAIRFISLSGTEQEIEKFRGFFSELKEQPFFHRRLAVGIAMPDRSIEILQRPIY